MIIRVLSRQSIVIMSRQLSSGLRLTAGAALGSELCLLIVGERPPLPLAAAQLVEEVHGGVLLPTRSLDQGVLGQLAGLLDFLSRRLIDEFSENLLCRIRESRVG